MALMLTRAGVMSRLGGFRSGARSLMSGADAGLRKQNRFIRTGTVALSAFGFGLLQGKFKDKGGAVAWGLPVDLLAGGPPCTSFSSAGLGLGENDERNGFPAFIGMIKRYNPRAVLIENVNY